NAVYSASTEKWQTSTERMPKRRNARPKTMPASPTSRPRMNHGWLGYAAWPKPQMNAATTMAKAVLRKSRSKNGTENTREISSSEIAGRKPKNSTYTHGNVVDSRSEYATSRGDQAPRRW